MTENQRDHRQTRADSDDRMTPEQYERVRELFLAARAQEPARRTAFLRAACADAAARAEVESLLANDARADTFLKTPVLGTGFALGTPEELAAACPPDARGPAPCPERIGPYRVLGVLGEGGMGVVYRAEQEHPRRIVALKVIRPGVESRETLRRFEHEGQVLAWLQHPGIAQVFETGTVDMDTGTRPFFAMEYIQGRSLSDYAERARPGIRQRLELLARLCDAVHHAHQKGVIHRDLKPGNILVDDTGQPKIVDFGVARATDADLRLTTVRTDLGRLIGTIAYMSPEQVAGDPREVDTRSDVYALGVVAYELLTGQTPIDVAGKSLPDVARAITEQEPPPLRALNRALRGDLETIIAKALEKDKTRRYQSASDLASDLRRYLADQPITARPPTALYQFRKFARRNRALVGGVAAAVLALCGGIAGTSYGLVRANAQRAAAETERNRAVEAERLAEQRRAAAETAALKVQTINEFINSMLASADPGRVGREVRVVDVLKRAVDELEAKLGDQPEIEAALRNTIGVTYFGLGEARDAEPQLRAALATRAAVLGLEHADTLAALTNLGVVLLETGDLAEGEAHLRQVLETRQRLLGPEHPQTLDAMSNLANAFQRRGRVAEAEQLWRDTLAAQRRVLPAKDPQLATVLNNLGQLLKQLNRPAAAEPLLREALEIDVVAHGEEHPQTLSALSNLAMTLKALEQHAEAEALLRRIVNIRRRTLGEHPALYTAISNLARALDDQGRLAEAEPLAREAVAGMRATAGAESESTLISMNNLASLLVRLDRAAEAEPLYVELRASAQRALPPDHFTLHIFARNHGECLTALGRYDEAETLLIPSYEALVRRLGARHQHTRKTLQCLVALYEAWGRTAQADAYRARLE